MTQAARLSVSIISCIVCGRIVKTTIRAFDVEEIEVHDERCSEAFADTRCPYHWGGLKWNTRIVSNPYA